MINSFVAHSLYLHGFSKSSTSHLPLGKGPESSPSTKQLTRHQCYRTMSDKALSDRMAWWFEVDLHVVYKVKQKQSYAHLNRHAYTESPRGPGSSYLLIFLPTLPAWFGFLLLFIFSPSCPHCLSIRGLTGFVPVQPSILEQPLESSISNSKYFH